MVAPLIAISLVAASSPAQAIEPGRAAILAAARPVANREVGQKMEFRVRTLRVEGRWAFLIAGMRNPGGGAIKFAGASRAAAQRAGTISRDYVALLSRSDAGWSVVASAVGPTDAVWADRSALYGVPATVVRP